MKDQANGDLSKYLTARQVVELVEGSNTGQVWIAGHFGGVSMVKSPHDKRSWLYHPDVLDVLTIPARLAAAKKAAALHYQVKNAKPAKRPAAPAPVATPPPEVPSAQWLYRVRECLPPGWDIAADVNWRNGTMEVRSVMIAPKGGKL